MRNVAHAYLVVTTAAQRRSDTTGTTLITLTVNKLRRLFDALMLSHCTPSPTSWPGRDGAENTKPEPEPATTENTINNNDRDLRLRH